jgi:hypothetical protein
MTSKTKYNKDILNSFSDEELQKELKLREGRKTIPPMLSSESINLTRLRNSVAEHMLSIANTGHGSKDGEHYIFEEAVKTFYGNDIFNWINEYNRGEG